MVLETSSAITELLNHPAPRGSFPQGPSEARMVSGQEGGECLSAMAADARSDSQEGSWHAARGPPVDPGFYTPKSEPGTGYSRRVSVRPGTAGTGQERTSKLRVHLLGREARTGPAHLSSCISREAMQSPRPWGEALPKCQECMSRSVSRVQRPLLKLYPAGKTASIRG